MEKTEVLTTPQVSTSDPKQDERGKRIHTYKRVTGNVQVKVFLCRSVACNILVFFSPKNEHLIQLVSIENSPCLIPSYSQLCKFWVVGPLN